MFEQVINLCKQGLSQVGIWLDSILSRIGLDVVPFIISAFLFFIVVRTLLIPLIGQGLGAGSDKVSQNETVKKEVKSHFGR